VITLLNAGAGFCHGNSEFRHRFLGVQMLQVRVRQPIDCQGYE
jgi:hypothetical protein